jgi:hypothetical protein
MCSDLGCVARYLSANVITVGRFQHPISRKGRPAAVLVFLLLPSASRIAALAIANTSVARLAPRYVDLGVRPPMSLIALRYAGSKFSPCSGLAPGCCPGTKWSAKAFLVKQYEAGRLLLS